MEVVSWLEFPSDISICVIFPPESHPLSPFQFSFSGSKKENLERKHYLYNIPLTHLPSTNLYTEGGESSDCSSILLTSRGISFIPVSFPTLRPPSFPTWIITIPLSPPRGPEIFHFALKPTISAASRVISLKSQAGSCYSPVSSFSDFPLLTK